MEPADGIMGDARGIGRHDRQRHDRADRPAPDLHQNPPTRAYGLATHPLKDGEVKPYKTEIFFLKAMLAGHLEWDLEQYAVEHADFPRRTTGDQFYDEWDFEAYRALGYSLGPVPHRPPSGPRPPLGSVTRRRQQSERPAPVDNNADLWTRQQKLWTRRPLRVPMHVQSAW